MLEVNRMIPKASREECREDTVGGSRPGTGRNLV